jgi:EAL domain-containing protein (putative c-di-GMP-specific phosphodiesterase class I)
VAPVDFIPLAEQTGLIIPIGEWVLRTACAEATAWPDHVCVAVNLSPVQTKNKNMVALVRETLAQTGLPARRLELEITETVLRPSKTWGCYGTARQPGVRDEVAGRIGTGRSGWNRRRS